MHPVRCQQRRDVFIPSTGQSAILGLCAFRYGYVSENEVKKATDPVCKMPVNVDEHTLHVASGPFVMNTEAEIRRAIMDYQSWQMGRIAV